MNADEYRALHKRTKDECTGCGKTVRPPRRRWCSDLCIETHRVLYDWGYAKHLVFKRDQGVCCECSCSTVFIQKVRYRVRQIDRNIGFYADKLWIQQGFDNMADRLYHVDHIMARRDGGDNSLGNLRTLCVPCHKKRTKAQRAAWRSSAPPDAPQLLLF